MLTGYSDRLGARPGETLSFMVSTDANVFQAEIVRLIHGDTDARGPGRREVRLEAGKAKVCQGETQVFFPGSYICVPDRDALQLRGDFTIFVWVYPTRLDSRSQVILSKQAPDNAGYALGLTDMGSLFLRIGSSQIVGSVPLQERRWQWVAATYEAATGSAHLSGGLHKRDLSVIGDMGAEGSLSPAEPSEAPFLIAASGEEGRPQNVFNGKIANPCLFDRCMSSTEIAALVQCPDQSALPQPCIAAWDLGVGSDGATVQDVAGHGLHGTAHQSPVRAMTGPHWAGDTESAHVDPRGYSAMHFHEDSLSDAGWRESFAFTLPDDLESGVYAARLQTADEIDYLPFFVCPPKGKATNDIAMLVPTFTYVAYGNELWGEYGLNCVYDRFVDGAGVPYASSLHPLKTFRPERGLLKSVAGERFGRHLCADLYFVDWLAAIGQKIDVITDHDLHMEGAALIKPYKAIVTGSHPEYVSAQILDALEAYLDGGGSLAYLGGNGFYSVTSLSPDGTMIEVRRPNGSRPWSSDAGEGRHSMTGEIGGLWRFRSRAPQRLVGVGFTAQGWTSKDQCGLPRAFSQVADRGSPLAAELLDGIAPDEKIGDFPTLGLGVGAAGDEIDRADPSLGTPAQAMVLASATGFSTDYQLTIEERRDVNEASTLPGNPFVRADIVCFDTARGGIVFSVGSMQWFSALSYNGYDNNVATLTRNVLNRMLR